MNSIQCIHVCVRMYVHAQTGIGMSIATKQLAVNCLTHLNQIHCMMLLAKGHWLPRLTMSCRTPCTLRHIAGVFHWVLQEHPNQQAQLHPTLVRCWQQRQLLALHCIDECKTSAPTQGHAQNTYSCWYVFLVPIAHSKHSTITELEQESLRWLLMLHFYNSNSASHYPVHSQDYE